MGRAFTTSPWQTTGRKRSPSVGKRVGVPRPFDIATGKELRTIKYFDFFTYSPDGKLFGAGDHTRRLNFWGFLDGKPVREIAP